MEIQSGKLYVNRTWEYLYPCLKFYGEELTDKLKKLFKLAVGIDDKLYKSTYSIYILFDVSSCESINQNILNYRSNFTSFLEWVRKKDYYVTDYVYDLSGCSEKHMVVLKIPKIYNKSFEYFLQGKYSQMYSKEAIDFIFSDITLENKTVQNKINKQFMYRRLILTKDKRYLPFFVKRINEDFDVDMPISDFEGRDIEFEYPIVSKQEIFNF